MPAATLIVASLAALEPPRPGHAQAIVQTTWSLTASPAALAAAAQQPPVVGPAQVVLPSPFPPKEQKPEVTVLPAPDSPADPFDELNDPAEAAQPTATDPAVADPTAAEAPNADVLVTDTATVAPDPFEEELAKSLKPANDPLEPLNRISFAVSMAVDKIVLRPLSLGYRKIAPKPMRDGLRNVLTNFSEPMVFINDILQLKPKRALRTLARFVLNTLLGLGGLFDVAKEKKFNIPYHPNRFANTLGFYGIKPGPYVYLPILGPTTLRDQGDRFQAYVPGFDNPIFRNGRGEIFGYLSGLDTRAENDQALKALLEDSVDPYATFRETWLQDRQGEIDRLKAPDGQEPGSFTPSPLDTLDDPLVDPAAPVTATGPAAPAEPAAPADPPVEAEPVTSATAAP